MQLQFVQCSNAALHCIVQNQHHNILLLYQIQLQFVQCTTVAALQPTFTVFAIVLFRNTVQSAQLVKCAFENSALQGGSTVGDAARGGTFH